LDKWPEEVEFDPTVELRLLVGEARPNALVIGPKKNADNLLSALGDLLQTPVSRSRRADMPWEMRPTARTIVIEDVAALDPGAQRRLMTWLDDEGPRVQVLSLSLEPLFPQVAAGRFLEELYYRLCVVMVPLTSPELKIRIGSSVVDCARSASSHGRDEAVGRTIRDLAAPASR
jgi:hypothetical protein